MNYKNNRIQITTNQIQRDECGKGTIEFVSVAFILLVITYSIINVSGTDNGNATVQAIGQQATQAVIAAADAADIVLARLFDRSLDIVGVLASNLIDFVASMIS